MGPGSDPTGLPALRPRDPVGSSICWPERQPVGTAADGLPHPVLQQTSRGPRGRPEAALRERRYREPGPLQRDGLRGPTAQARRLRGLPVWRGRVDFRYLFYRAADPNGRGGQGMHQDALNLPASCYWCCSGHLKLSDDQVLLVLLWPSQAVRRPGITGVALAISSCPTTRYYWCCSGHLKLSDDQVLLVLLWPSQAVRRPGITATVLPPKQATTATLSGGTSVLFFLRRKI
ncbi:hypothetical protein QF036_005042 [Arthrobacter globiformis]|nr:hypothetical protein [Arthrobacter globiformis]